MALDQSHHDRAIDYIEFTVADNARSKAFYGEAFGWTFKDYGDEYTTFKDGRLSGGFSKADHVVAGGPLVWVVLLPLSVRMNTINPPGEEEACVCSS